RPPLLGRRPPLDPTPSLHRTPHRPLRRCGRGARNTELRSFGSLSRQKTLGEGTGEGGELEGGLEEGKDQGEGRGAFRLDGDAFASHGVLGGAAGDGV